MVCRCRSFDNPHGIQKHNEIKESDWRTESERRTRFFQEHVKRHSLERSMIEAVSGKRLTYAGLTA
jgi:hypothetical protein